MTARALDRYLSSPRARTAAAALFAFGTLLLTLGIPGLQRFIPYRIDLDVYRTGGQVFRDGGDLYGELPALAEGAHLPFTYPPLSAEIFALLTYIPLPVVSTMVTLASVVCLGLVLGLVLRAVTSYSRGQVSWLVVAVLAVGLWFGPVRETLGFGQVNIFLMTLVVVDCLRGRGRWWGGALIGLAAAVKLTPAVFVLYLLIRRDWRSAAVAVASAAAFTGLGHLLAPGDSTRYWTFAIKDPARIGGLDFASNQSINGVVHRLGFTGSEASVLWFALCCVVGLAIAVVLWRLVRAGQDVAAVLMTGLIALFCSPVAWGHHWVWSVPIVALLVLWWARARHGERGGRLWGVLAAVGALIFVTTPQWWFPHSNDAELAWGPVAHLLGNAYQLWALAVLVAVGIRAASLGAPDRGVSAPQAVFPELAFGQCARR